MPTLTGRLHYVTGQPVPPEAIRHVTVKATTPRPDGAALITTRTVDIDHTGTLTVDMRPGEATLTADLDTGHDTFDLQVETGMTTIHQAALAALARRY